MIKCLGLLIFCIVVNGILGLFVMRGKGYFNEVFWRYVGFGIVLLFYMFEVIGSVNSVDGS